MNYIKDLFFVFLKLVSGYALYNVAIWLNYSLDYAIISGVTYYFLLVLTKVGKIHSLITAFMSGVMATTTFALFVSMFPHSSFYFWIFGYDKVFLFE